MKSLAYEIRALIINEMCDDIPSRNREIWDMCGLLAYQQVWDIIRDRVVAQICSHVRDHHEIR